MTRRKKYTGIVDVYDPKTRKIEKIEHLPTPVVAKRKYYLKKQPPEAERWTHTQFQQWVEDIGFPRKDPDDTGTYVPLWFPFDPQPVAKALGIKTNRVYVYWRGYDKKPDVVGYLPATTTLLCKALLELKRLGKWQP